MTGLFKAATNGLDSLFVDVLNSKMDEEKRAKIAERLKKWLSEDVRKKPLPDLPQRIANWNLRFDELAKTLELKMEGNEPVVKAAGKAGETLRILRNGSDWFDPCKSVVALVISALWERS